MKFRCPLPRTVLALCLAFSGVLLALPQSLAGQEQASQKEVRAAAGRFTQALDGEDWPKAIEAGHRLVELSPKNHVHPYNLACAYARSGDTAKAILWLDKAVHGGFSDPTLMEGDSDLESLQGLKGYDDAIKRAEKNYDLARKLFLEMAKGSEPVILGPKKTKEGAALPVLVVLHGYGGRSEDFAAVFKNFAEKNEVIVVAPRSVVPTPGGKGFEWATVADTTYLVDRSLEAVKRSHRVDEKRIVLLGFSQGAAMAFHIGMQEPFRFRGVIPIAGRYSPAIISDFSNTAPNRPRFFLMVGGRDGSAELNRKALRDLSDIGVSTKLAVYPNVGHTFPRDWEGELRKALKFFFKEGR